MKMKKIVSFVSAVALSTAFLLPQAISASAVYGTEDTLPYILRFEPDRTFVSAEEVAQGDVIIPAAVYLSGSTANNFGGGSLRFHSDSNDVYFQNMRTGVTRTDTEQTYSSSQGTFTTTYVPYCFGRLAGNGRYTNDSPIISTKEYACDPVFGSSLTSTGDGRVKFTASYYADSSKSQKITKEFVCDVTVDADGNGTYTYDYIEQGSYLTQTMTATLPRYDATLPADSLIPDTCNSIAWTPGLSSLTTGLSFFGDTSDEFPLFYVDIVIKQGTTAGVYDIAFDNDSSTLYGDACQLASVSQKNYLFEKQGTSIAVGMSNAAVTSVEASSTIQNDVALYASYDTHTIQASTFASSILADVTYADGTTAQNVDITNLVDCNGATPADLFQAASNGYFSSNVTLYFNGSPLKKSDGSTLTQKIMVGTKGDVNYNGVSDITDAFLTLLYCSNTAAGNVTSFYSGTSTDPNMELLTIFLADTDTCTKVGETSTAKIEISDAFDILLHSSIESAGSSSPWDGYIK